MRLIFAVLILFVAYCASYPTASENELDFQLRSLLNQLDEEQDVAQSFDSDDNDESDDEEFEVSKRSGGRDIIDKQSKCEIQCIHRHRFPGKGIKGKNIKKAAKVCRNECPNTKPADKKPMGPKISPQSPRKKMNKREFDDDESYANEQQEYQRRQLYDYLLGQLEEN